MTQPPADVIAAAQAGERKWKIPSSVTLAQWALESAWGQHIPAGSNNCFGIKALGDQPSVSVPTHEYVHGRYVLVQASFRKFESIAEAIDAHDELLATGLPYCRARTFLPDPFKFANALAGVYATDPAYGIKLGEIIRGSSLTQYDAAD